MTDPATPLAGEELQLTGETLLEAISSGLLLLYGEHYGGPPKRVRTYLNDNVLVSVLQEDVFDPSELDAVRRGADDRVLAGRIAFQREHQAEFIAMVERLSGRRVISFLSANQTRPGVAAELFILDR